MGTQKDTDKLYGPASAAAADDAKKKINDILDEIFSAAARGPQMDSF